ncbi:MAG: hypothetical protein ABW275_06075 [Hansschlegelia sp.]
MIARLLIAAYLAFAVLCGPASACCLHSAPEAGVEHRHQSAGHRHAAPDVGGKATCGFPCGLAASSAVWTLAPAVHAVLSVSAEPALAAGAAAGPVSPPPRRV